MLLAPGKRFRPILVLAAYDLCCRSSDNQDNHHQIPLRAACAVEMIHSYSLIHDDLPAMDNDDLRRGIPTCHRKFDEATAILAGDALQTSAFQEITGITPPELAVQCCRELACAAGVYGLVGGQMGDIIHEKKIDHAAPAIEILEKIHLRKTGSLIRTSLNLGGIIAIASAEQLSALSNFGYYFGLAFQITDDLLDVLGNEQTAGKRLRKDDAMDKWSYPRFLGVDGAKQAAAEAVANAGKALDIFEQDSKPLKLLREMIEQLPNRKK
jgi:geranylgeranyl diphosphate synthase type II